jgi:capsular polysaccharide transport system permease protein
MGGGALAIAAAFGMPNAEPYNVGQIVLSVIAMSFTAFGVGLFNSCLVEYFGAWRLLWSVIARSLIFFSNVFYVVDFLPPIARKILWWNPVLHGVIWFRIGLYPNYPTLTFSPSYMLAFSAVMLLAGMIMERILRRSE